MPKKNMRIKIILLLCFLLSNSLFFTLTEINKRQKINLIINNNIKNLQTQYNVIDHVHQIDAKIIYLSIQNNPQVQGILTQIENANDKKRALLREQLYQHLEQRYNLMKLKGVLHFHFVLPDNTTFLRMHKPTKFGDNLSEIRYSFANTNKTHEPTIGFEQGKTAHGFRHTYPIWDKDNNYLCALDIGYGSEVIQTNLTQVNQLHTHFLVKKDIFNVKIWEREGVQLKYIPSLEHADYMFAITQYHIPREFKATKQALSTAHKKKIQDNMDGGKTFGLYFFKKKKAVVISFIPIVNLKDKKTLAYLVSYRPAPFIKTSINTMKTARYVMFSLLASLFYFIYRTILSVQKEKRFNLELAQKVKTRTHELEIQTKKAEEIAKELKTLATKDSLTNLYNRRFFSDITSQTISLAKRQNTVFSILYIDVDKFKDINDSYGHCTGDEALKLIAMTLSSNTRESDIVARFGGEEFIILLPDTDLTSAQVIAEKIRQNIEESPLQIDAETIHFTISIGISQFNAKTDTLIDPLINRADQALYEAKNTGRNKVVVEYNTRL